MNSTAQNIPRHDTPARTKQIGRNFKNNTTRNPSVGKVSKANYRQTENQPGPALSEYDYQHQLPEAGNPSLRDRLISLTNDVLAEAGNSLTDYNERTVVLNAVRKFTHCIGKTTRGTFIGIVHGSYATGNQRRATSSSRASDIDVMFSCDNDTYRHLKTEVAEVISHFLENLHSITGAMIDDEVPAESKYLVPAATMMEAALGSSFYPDGNDQQMVVRPLSDFLLEHQSPGKGSKSSGGRFSPEFLASRYLLHRLIFNILTSPHKVYSNHLPEAEKLKSVAAIALRNLSVNLQHMGGQPGSSGVEHLFADNHQHGQNRGEMFLGYKRERNGVIEHLKSLIGKEKR